MYVLASQCNREVSVQKVKRPETAILNIVQELYNQLMDLEGYSLSLKGYKHDDVIAISDMSLKDVFDDNQDNPADHYRNLQKLKYFLSYSVAVFLHIQKVGSLHIWFEDEPMYAISIIYENGNYTVGAHSDIEDYYRWDKIIEQIV